MGTKSATTSTRGLYDVGIILAVGVIDGRTPRSMRIGPRSPDAHACVELVLCALESSLRGRVFAQRVSANNVVPRLQSSNHPSPDAHALLSPRLAPGTVQRAAPDASGEAQAGPDHVGSRVPRTETSPQGDAKEDCAVRFRKKPVVIEAIQFDGSHESADEIISFWPAIKKAYGPRGYLEGLQIKTLEGTMRADGGDWIIQGVKGELYPCKPDIFEATYESEE